MLIVVLFVQRIYQSPLGSICQYRFTHQDMLPIHPLLLQTRFYSAIEREIFEFPSEETETIIGLSWRGGGTSERMNQKSIPIPELAKALFFEDVLFVSLQYGDCAADVAKFRIMVFMFYLIVI